MYEYASNDPVTHIDPMALFDPLLGLCHFLFRGWDVTITERSDPNSQLLSEVKALPSIRTSVEDAKDRARRAMSRAGKKMMCGSTEPWSSGRLREAHTVPLRRLGLRLTLQRFTLFRTITCTFKKKCCTEKCKGLPVDPCGLVMGKCKVELNVYDQYDFRRSTLVFLEPFGEDYAINIHWSETFTIGPEKICGDRKTCRTSVN